MKRYWLFGYWAYEAAGGLNDLVAWDDSLDDIKDLTEKSIKYHGCTHYDYYHILDSKSMTLILQGERNRLKKGPLEWQDMNVNYETIINEDTEVLRAFVPTPPKEKSVPYLP